MLFFKFQQKFQKYFLKNVQNLIKRQSSSFKILFANPYQLKVIVYDASSHKHFDKRFQITLNK